jgi:rod shape determining protein RodA
MKMKFTSKFFQISYTWLLVILSLVAIGVLMLYSAANGSWHPWAIMHLIYFVVGLVIFIFVSLVDIKLWFRFSYILYFVALALLLFVEIKGTMGMGAQRWFRLGGVYVQPSELVKITLVMSLARYYHSITYFNIKRLYTLIVPAVLLILPLLLVLKQPDLGTAMILIFVTGTILFLAGVSIWFFVTIIGMSVVSTPILWHFLKDYQKSRILTFLDPSRDPLGAGYHITQSKIALGSGGLTGQGYMEGTQSHLNFLPEKQTDFIFTMIGEEFGFLGASMIIVLYLILIVYGFGLAVMSQSRFGKLMGLGMISSLFFFMFVNIAMVMGLLPVVGEPLPLVSYGGTSMVTTMIALGLIMNVSIHRETVLV